MFVQQKRVFAFDQFFPKIHSNTNWK